MRGGSLLSGSVTHRLRFRASPSSPPPTAQRERKRTRLNSTHRHNSYSLFFFNDTATTEIYTLSLHDALPIYLGQPDAAIIDKAGFRYFFPGEPLQVGKTLQMNERRVLIVGISDASAPFQSFPVLHTRYSQALGFVGRERNLMPFVLAKPVAGVSTEDVCHRIETATGLRDRKSTR